MWAAPVETPALPRILAQLPFRHVWTTFPGDVLEHSFETASPEAWPPARVVSYQELGELSPRRRTLVKMLGNFDTYVVTPNSVRRALSRAVDLREYARELYVEGSLVFVGFRYGDPDLSALLGRGFVMFEPPRGTHCFRGSMAGPGTVGGWGGAIGVMVAGGGTAGRTVTGVGVGAGAGMGVIEPVVGPTRTGVMGAGGVEVPGCVGAAGVIGVPTVGGKAPARIRSPAR
jgi:hypothetical protein